MSKSRTTTLAFSVVGENELYTELGKAIRISTNTHSLDERGFTLGIIGSCDLALTLSDAQEMLDSLKKAIKEAKKAELRRFEQVVERVSNLPSTITYEDED
jgi:hypothetical protein